MAPKRFTPRVQFLIPIMLLIGLALACNLPGQSTPAPGAPSPTPSLAESPTPAISPTPSITPSPTNTPAPLPPAVIYTSPVRGAEIPLAGPVTFYFNQPMDKTSVEGALSGQPALSGRFDWLDDTTLVFEPDAPFLPETDLTVTIGETAQAVNGLAMLAPVNLSFKTTGYLELSQAIPEADSAEVAIDAAVVAAFNRPVVPLGADPASLPVGFTLEPAVAGVGKWLNTSTYIFTPEAGLEGGRTYSVRLNPALQSTDGGPLEGDAEWSFSTASPRLVSATPENDAFDVGLEPWIQLTFSQPMDSDSVAANFALTSAAGQTVSGEFEWNKALTEVRFIPDSLLARDTDYTVSLNAGAQARGGTALGVPFSFGFRTHSALTFSWWRNKSLYFTAPLANDQDLLPYISVSPQVDNLGYWWNGRELMLNLSGNFAADTDYVVTLDAALPGAYGDTLGRTVTVNIHTDPLRPNFFLATYESLMFLTPQDAGVTAQATNLSEVTMQVGTAPLDDLLYLLGSYSLPDYYPSDQHTWTVPLNLPSDEMQSVSLPLMPGGGALSPGLYHVRISTPDLSYNPSPFLVLVSNTHLTLKLGAEDALVWAVDLQSGQPVANAPITLYNLDGSVLASSVTGADGVAQFAFPPREDAYGQVFAVFEGAGAYDPGLALANWGQGPHGFGIPFRYDSSEYKTYVYTDRPIYRPGQTVYFRAIHRAAANARYSLPDQSRISLTMRDWSGRDLTELDLPLSEYGTAHGQYTLAESAEPGYYTLNTEYGSVMFQVAEYRKPEIDLQVTMPEDAQTGDTLQAAISAQYYFGAAAGDVAVSWSVYARQPGFPLPLYRVGKTDTRWLLPYWMLYDGYYGQLIESGEGRTDADGLLMLELPTGICIDDAPVEDTCLYELEATVQDESGFYVSARAETTVHPGPVYVGVQPGSWVGRAGEGFSFALQTVDWDQQPAGGRSVSLEFSSIVWKRQFSNPGDPYSYPTFVPEYTLIDQTSVTTADDGTASVSFTPPNPGVYQLTANSEGAVTELLVWVGGPGQAVWPDMLENKLQLTPDQESYRPGDTAQIFIPNEFGAGVQALVTVERDAIMRYETLTLDEAGLLYTLPLTEDDAPNVYLSVLLIDPAGNAFRQGYAELTVEPVAHTLTVEVLDMDAVPHGPQEDVTLEIRVTDADGQPVVGEFSVSVVDLAVLALADSNAPDILPAFYGRQPLGVRTGLALAVYARQDTLADAGGRGGGGGGDVPSVREDFEDVAYWSATIVTNPDGTAQVTFTLPDNLTTWQIDVRGITKDSRVGQGVSQIVTTKDLLVRPVTPRFFVLGDHAQLAAVVHNNTADDLTVEVTLDATGFMLDDEKTGAQTVSIPAGGRVRVAWWGIAQDAAGADLVFSAQATTPSGDLLTDASRPQAGELPVLRYLAPYTYATAGTMDTGGERLELVSLPPGIDPSGGELRLELSPSLAAAMIDALDALEESPYRSTEAALSRFLPNLEAYRALRDLGLESPDLEARLERTLDAGISRLVATQNFDGGWSWWPEGSHAESNPYVTAYVLFGLARAQAAGADVPAITLENAAIYLYENTPDMRDIADEPWRLDRAVFAEYALTEAGAGRLGIVGGLYDVRDQLNPWSQALLALSIEALSPGDPRVGTLLADLQSTAVRSATGAHWEETAPGWRNMSNTLFNSGMVVYAVSQLDPASTLLPEAVRYLMAHREASGGWSSTYTSAWAIMSLTEYMKGSGELRGDFDFSATLNGIPFATGQAGGDTQLTPVRAATPVDQLYAADPNGLLLARGDGPGRLYYTAFLEVNFPVEDVPSLNQGISLSRAYYPFGEACPDDDCAPIHSAAAGDLVTVRLTLVLPHDMYYLMVEDYIPAGAEVMDTSLKTSQQIRDDGPLFSPRRPFAGGWGWWYFGRQQIFDTHVAWSTNYLPAGTYELTYVLVLNQPGEYRTLPARAWELYFPEVQGGSEGGVFEIAE